MSKAHSNGSETCPNAVWRYQFRPDGRRRIIWVPCHKKSCPVCRVVWNTRHIEALRTVVPTERELWYGLIDARTWNRARRPLGHAGASYVKAVVSDGSIAVLANRAFPGASTLSPGACLESLEWIIRESQPHTRLVLAGEWNCLAVKPPPKWTNGPVLPKLTLDLALAVLKKHHVSPAIYLNRADGGTAVEWLAGDDEPLILFDLRQAYRTACVPVTAISLEPGRNLPAMCPLAGGQT